VTYACVAVTADGEIVARTSRVAHLAARPARPRTAEEARRAAGTALDAIADEGAIGDLDPSLHLWLAAVRSTHQSSIDRQIQREKDLRSACTTPSLIQPGLFERRTGDVERIRGDVNEEHDRRIARLERRREISLMCEPLAVVVAWR
jgi:hypothetical protein